MIVLSIPPIFYRFVQFGLAALCGYLPAHLILTYWRWPGVFFIAGLLFLPLPISLTIHLMHLLPYKIHFLWQCGFLGCTAASVFFIAKRLGWLKT